jgi:hypothetical protein
MRKRPMLEMQREELPNVSRSLPAPTRHENGKGGPPGRLRPPVGEVVSIYFFDHAALARIDQVGPVLAMDVAVVAERWCLPVNRLREFFDFHRIGQTFAPADLDLCRAARRLTLGRLRDELSLTASSSATGECCRSKNEADRGAVRKRVFILSSSGLRRKNDQEVPGVPGIMWQARLLRSEKLHFASAPSGLDRRVQLFWNIRQSDGLAHTLVVGGVVS